jgi:cytosine/uracil/thiamine/allantoin permease
MSPLRIRWILRVSCICALAGLALMTWQLFEPRVVPIIVAMSLGQILGTASFAAYLFVVFDDFRTHRRAQSDSQKSDGT